MLDKMEKCILAADLYTPAPKFHDMKLKLALYMTVMANNLQQTPRKK